MALTLVVYLQVGRFGFIPIDDNLYVTKQAHIRDGLSFRATSTSWAFTSFYDCNWIPLTWISLMVDATFYGTSPGGHHLANLALHVANVLLVFAVFRRATGNFGRSVFVAALFAVHPLHVESVAWIAERKDVLSLFFGLLALSSYVAYAKDGQVKRFCWALVFYLCSLLSKQTLVTLPCVLLLFDYWPLHRYGLEDGGRGSRALIVEKLPFFAISAAFCVVELVAQVHGHSTRSLVEFPIWARVLNGVLVYALYYAERGVGGKKPVALSLVAAVAGDEQQNGVVLLAPRSMPSASRMLAAVGASPGARAVDKQALDHALVQRAEARLHGLGERLGVGAGHVRSQSPRLAIEFAQALPRLGYLSTPMARM